MVRLNIRLSREEAKALRIMCRRFQFGDAQYFLQSARNVKPDHLCEAISRLREALDDASDPPGSL